MPRKRNRRDTYGWGAPAEGDAPPGPRPDPLGIGQEPWTPLRTRDASGPGRITLEPRFTPSAPVESKEVFAGRASQAQRLLNAIYDKGQHVVLFGERGAGKTSLALVTAGALPPFDWGSLRVSCNADETFASLWEQVIARFIEIGDFDPDARPPADSLRSPSEVVRALGGKGKRNTVIFIDEFDRVRDQQVSFRMADLIKMVSDERHDVTIVIIGVADEASRLVVAHPSVQRALVDIHLPRMTTDELRQVVIKAAGAMDIEIDPRGTDIIAYLSFGLPYFAHLIGLAASRAALEGAATTKIELAPIREGIAAAALQMPDRLRVAYDDITSVPARARWLVACALAEKNRDRFFGPDALHHSFRALYGQVQTETPLGQSRAWGDMIEENRGASLPWRFIDPLFAPFCVLRALAEGHVEEHRLLKLFSEYEAKFPDATELAFPFFDPDAKQALKRRPPPVPRAAGQPPPPPPPPRRPPPAP